MIQAYAGEFTISPIALEMSMNFCSHKCAYCTTPDTLITLDNLTSKPIGDIAVGDNILGWVGDQRTLPTPTGKYGFTESKYRKWVSSKVTSVNKRKAEVFEVYLESGEIIKCTADHNWFTGGSGDYEYQPLVGKRSNPINQLTKFSLDSISELKETDVYMIGYIRGFAEGDGTWMPQKNWRIAAKDLEPLYRIAEYLDLLGYERPEIKSYGETMMQVSFKPNGKENELINGLDIDSIEYWRGWLSGIYDAEGNTPARLSRVTPEALSISQYKSQNILTYNRIERALRLFNFGFVCGDKQIRVVGGRLEAARFTQLMQPSIKRKNNPLIGSTHKGLLSKNRVEKIVSIGVTDVISLSTETGNYIAGNHLSSNCFANLNQPNRKLDVTKAINQIKNCHTGTGLTSYLLANEFPVLLSNRVDPFANTNWRQSLTFIELFNLNKNKIAFQTKGGVGIDEALSLLDYKAHWYVSISFWDDNIRKLIEPAAPSIQERFELIEKLISNGHFVSVGINPLVEEWLNLDDYEKMLEKLWNIGVRDLWIEVLHLNAKQISRMSAREVKNIGDITISEATKRQRNASFFYLCHEIATNQGFNVFSMNQPMATNYFESYKEHYKSLPTHQDLINVCLEKYPNGGLLRFSEYKKFMSLPFYDDKFNEADGYAYRIARNVWKDYLDGSLKTLTQVLEFYWLYPQVSKSIFTNFLFEQIGVKGTGGSLAVDKSDKTWIAYFNAGNQSNKGFKEVTKDQLKEIPEIIF